MSMRPAYLESSAWTEHIPFAFWLIEAHRPRQVVELGTHNGTSYFAFCQAVERLGLNTRCFAVDTWKGDEHAGFYGEEVFQKVRAYNDAQYSSFSRLVRSTFDDALNHFSDGTIDLLHIDGLHTLEAVRHDLETWMPKLSERAVVVMHDTNVRERNFGVYKLFEELRERYPCFEFVHGHGLGVLGIGVEQNEQLRRLFEAQDDDSARRAVHDVFSRLGRACADAFSVAQQQEKKRELESTVSGQKKKVDVLQKALASAKDEMEQRSRELGKIRLQLTEQSEQRAIELGRLAERNDLLKDKSAELDQEVHRLRASIKELKAELKVRVGALKDERASIEELKAELKECVATLERSQQDTDDHARRLGEIQDERDRLQLENGKLTKNVQTRFDEIAKLTRMLLEAEQANAKQKTRLNTIATRAVKFLAEIARLDRSLEVSAPQVPSGKGAQNVPSQRSLDVFSLAKDPVVVDSEVQGESEISVELKLFGDVKDRRTAAASLLAKAYDSEGKMLADVKWIGDAAAANQPPRYLNRFAARKGWSLRSSELPKDSVVLAASQDGERFLARLSLPSGTACVRLECKGLDIGYKLVLVRGDALLADRPVEPNEKLDIHVDVRSERPLKRALFVVPQFLDADGLLLPPPYDGFLSDETRPAFGHLAGGKTGRRNELRTVAPPTAVRLRLWLQPALARGKLEIQETEPASQAKIVWSMVKTPTRKGKVEASFTLFGPRDEPQAAMVVPSFYGSGGEMIPGPHEGFESSDLFPAFRYLSARPTGTRTDLALVAPPGTRKCKLEVVPYKITFGLRIEPVPVAEEAAHIDGVLLSAEGIVLEQDIGTNADLAFKVRGAGARDLKVAGLCAVTYMNAAGEVILPPYPGLKAHGELAALPFGVSRKPSGRVTGVRLEPPHGAVRVRLRFVPNDPDDALCIRIEPMSNQRSILRTLR